MKNEEYQIQCKIANYLEELKLKKIVTRFTAIPNSTYTKSIIQKIKNTKSGLRAGLCDLFIIIKNEAFFVEVKTKKGTLQETQKEWIRDLHNSNTKAYIVASLEEFKVLIDDIIQSQKKELEMEDTAYFVKNMKGSKLFKKHILKIK